MTSTNHADRFTVLNNLANRASDLTAQADGLIQNGRTEDAMPLLKLAESYRNQALAFSRIQWETDDITLRAETARRRA